MRARKIYLSAAYYRRSEIRAVKERIEREVPGTVVISRWLYEKSLATSDAESTAAHLARAATIDLEDERACDTYCRFSDSQYFGTELVSPSLLSAARMTEFGVAIERRMRMLCVGGRQNAFDYLTEVEHVGSVNEMIALLKEEVPHDA